ncbi:MAG: DNA primase catalytic subunit PriS [Candidatus Thermoplasmatota archaeon]|nr:DNA primase catalytic subunit PriS [Candidatus Thermoplasmatota archaeon]
MDSFLQERFRRYYSSAEVPAPRRFTRREYGFVFFDQAGMTRHVGFKRHDELLELLRERAPAHVYHSSAYYETPDAGTMQEKGWMGADLIFDLDADHLPGAEHMRYEEMLAMVRQELTKLVSFLTEDFGFTDDELSLYFSGGRGYHCHVVHPEVLPLESQERREIVDYITGRGLDLDAMLREKTIARRGKMSQTALEIAPPTAPGWRGKISRDIVAFFQELKDMEQDEAMQLLTSFEGIGEKTARGIIEDVTGERIERIRRGKIDQSTYIKKIMPQLVKRCAVELRGEPDEPVTGDVKRLIRQPGSLHGKTGLRVTPVSLDDIDDFDPLRDAVVFKDEPVQMELQHPVEITMMEQSFTLEKGSAAVPEYLAVLLAGRNVATI